MLKYLYIDHKTKKVSKGEGNFPDPKKGCLWLFLSNPNEAEKNVISKEFDVPSAFVKNYSKELRSKRYSTTPLIFVMVDYFLQNGVVKNTKILIVIKKDLFITILPSHLDQFDAFFDEIVEYMGAKDEKNRNIGEVLYEFLDRDVQDNYEVLRRTEEKINELERKIILKNEELSHKVDEVLILKRELFAMSRRFWSTAKIVFLLKKGLLTVDISKKTASLLDDTYDTFQHQIEILETQRDMLGDVFALHQTAVSNRLAFISNDINTVMKQLTSLTVIVLIPSFIAGVYGMNFSVLPRVDDTYGFWEALGLMILSAAIMYYFFHKKKWI
ncbi:magnesium transporter CorA family protein [Candidatus Woesearchaeota archaeon]|nr:magnesium transporter CorA family protein [Candidatus Woesearchaeota archaeon]